MFNQLPPAGNPVALSVKAGTVLPSFFAAHQTQLYASGTAALAASICASIALKECARPEVILPAYGCPDLVSAIIYAGAQPVLVDLESDRPWLDLSKLADSINQNTVAIVAVNLFGISERWPQLRELTEQNQIVLIEDSAQYFPGGDETPNWQGDLVVFSFGRGKPVSLLAGGAVFGNDAELFSLLPVPQAEPARMSDRLMYGLKARLYNAMMVPRLYWLPQSLPFLHLGETRYHTLQGIEGMGNLPSELLATNISSYQDDEDASQRCKIISSMLELKEKVIDLPRACKMAADRRLLRYPVLVDASQHDNIYQRLNQAGLGVSKMYPASLPKIEGLNHIFDDKQQFSNADDFASRLITLPTHSCVGKRDIDKMGAILEMSDRE